MRGTSQRTWLPKTFLLLVHHISIQYCSTSYCHEIVNDVEDRENCNFYLIFFAHPLSLVKFNQQLDSGTMMVSLTPTPPSGSFSVTHLRFWYGRCIRLFFQYTAPIWLADWQCFLLFIFLTTRISASQLVRNRSNNHQCHHRWKDYKPFQQFPTYSGMTSFWSVHSIHWTSGVSPSFFWWA